VSSLREGMRVSYVGDGRDGRSLGDRGQLLVRQGSKGQVRWADGSITPHFLDDLESTSMARLAAAASDGLEDSLDVGPIQATGVRATYDTDGSAGVLNQLAATGGLTSFAEIAEDARAFVAARIRQDPLLREATAALDDDEREDLIHVASHVLLRDAFSEPE
jgi:hypothetical protein